jgi:hypothetical protein
VNGRDHRDAPAAVTCLSNAFNAAEFSFIPFSGHSEQEGWRRDTEKEGEAMIGQVEDKANRLELAIVPRAPDSVAFELVEVSPMDEVIEP